ncbi:MAG: DUF971 domain-containing protein [Myxococcota bacterium]
MPTPVDVALSNKQHTLTITWEDGGVSVLGLAYLRGWCPCAGCQGHGATVRFQPPEKSVEISEMYEAGAYALHIRFGDGHDSGIYSWEWLRRIAPETPPEGEKTGTYAHGEFSGAPPPTRT